jgi:hypothetical protein
MREWWRTENWDSLALVEFVLSLVLYVSVSRRNLQRNILLVLILATLYGGHTNGGRFAMTGTSSPHRHGPCH